ncbi:MAG: molybdopterin-guanine dinucleotide biosynthesis protein B [Azovibrio sp.]|nr:molybdopterin-guanine dinucleotide biosynthesis protein B [Azovibrio sp.]
MQAFGIAGRSGAGKTSLIERLIPVLKGRGLSVSVIKHAHHDFDIDKPGKDSWRHRMAGAGEVLLACNARWALMHELRGAPEPDLSDLLARLAPCDLVLVEGFKAEPIPKLEVYRPATGLAPLYPERRDILALASDAPLAIDLPCLPLDDAVAIVDFIMTCLALKEKRPC